MRELHAHPDLLDGVDAVIHLAGLANDPSCDLDPALTRAINLDGAVDLMNRARDAGPAL